MKKLIFAAILLTGTVAFANAQTPQSAPAPATEQVAPEAGYQTIAPAALSEAVQNAIKTIAADALDVKSVEFNAAKELTKVTLIDKADQSEKVVILDKEGNQSADAA